MDRQKPPHSSTPLSSTDTQLRESMIDALSQGFEGAEEFSSEAAAQARLLTHVAARIHSKIDDYARYQFSPVQTRCFNIFFDLAQELEEFEDLCALTVMLPEILFNVPAELFLLDPSGTILVRQTPGYGPASPPPTRDDLLLGVQEEEGFLRIPVHGKRMQLQSSPGGSVRENLGMLVFHTGKATQEHDRFFYQKFVNRVGFQLHNRLLVMKNKDHLRFINNLVHDIGHNVIVPNMYFKLLFHQLEGKIQGLSGVRERLEEASAGATGELGDAVNQLAKLQKILEDQYAEIYKYFLQSSLFLESLLRQSHFEKGHYVLQKSRVNLVERVLIPQMERYRTQLDERGISAQLEPSDSLEVPADVGLISQVVANFISNAVKYTRPSPANGEKIMHCSCRLEKNAFGPNRDGVRVTVLSSGPYIAPGEAPNLFKPDFRGSNTQNEYGTGHGLYFTCEIISRHGGKYGYEAAPRGNVFYFILPLNDDGTPVEHDD